MSELITFTKSNIKKMVPYAKNIVVKVERDHDQFLSKIHVNVPGKVLHAEKKAGTAWEAIEFSCQAIRKQIEKVKTRRLLRKKTDKRKMIDRYILETYD